MHSMAMRAHNDYNLFYFGWPRYSWAWDLAGVCLIYAVTIHLRKLVFPFPTGISWKSFFWSGVRLFVHFPFSMLGVCLVWTCAGLLHAVPVSMSSCFRWVIFCLSLSQSFHIFCIDSWALSVGNLVKDTSFRTQCPKSATSCVLSSCECLC